MVEQDAPGGETGPSLTAETAARLFGEHPSVMLLMDPARGEIVDANRAAADFYGWPPERLRGMPVDDLNTLAPAEVRAEINRAVAGSRSVFAFCHRLASGATRDVEVHSGPIDLDGRTLLLSVVVDVTERNEAVAALQASEELLARSAPTDDGLAGGLDQIREAGQRGAAVTRRILAYSRAHSGRAEAVEVAELVTGLRPMLDALVGDHVELQVRAAPAWVRINRRELEQGLLNLAVNACDAMPNGGAMTIDAALVGPGDEWVRLCVADTGAGMDADTLARATEAFFTTKDAEHGTGLGLSMVDELVTSVGGTLTVDSTPGQGTSVCLRLPVEGSEPSAPEPAGTAGQPAPARHVLVVEDDDSVRDLVTRLLERAGHRVTARASGESAWEHVSGSSERIDLLVTDTSMPGMTGRELADRFRTLLPDVGVVLMSGHPDAALAAVADPELTFLPKPFTGQELRDAVSAVLERA